MTKKESAQGRTLILCLDGTSNEISEKDTNVVKVFDMLIKDDPRQKVFYQPGIGTYTSPSFWTPVFRRIAKLLDLAFGWYLSAHVLSAYTFLVNHYKSPNDKIILVGFSRGAYTCRALAGMINKIGLIPADNLDLIPFAWKLYKDNNDSLAADFKAVTSRSVTIDQCLLFDTVNAVGTVRQVHLPFTGSNYAIRIFRHAVSLGERRVRFSQNLWQRKSDGPERNTPDVPSDRRNKLLAVQGLPPVPIRGSALQTDIKEVYFCGNHSDVGGHRMADTATLDLSHITLRFIMEEMLRTANPQVPILVDPTTCASYGIPIDPSKATSEETGPAWYTKAAIGAPRHDSLTDKGLEKYFWWLLEIVPMRQERAVYQGNGDVKWKVTWLPHFGRRRDLPPNALIHKSVQIRVENDPSYRAYVDQQLAGKDVHFVT